MWSTVRKLAVILCWAAAFPSFAQEQEGLEAGPLYAQFPLTLTSGYRREAAGPFYYSQESESQTQWALPPWFCYTRTRDVDWTEMEILYPLLSYRRFGAEYHLQIIEFFGFSGGQEKEEDGMHRFTLFPFYFQQRAPDTSLDYTALVPFYGHLRNRLFRDDIKFVMFPLYSETRKKDVVTDNYLFPIFDVRRGDHLTGWQVWPLYGTEHKEPTFRTNTLDEREIVAGFNKYFAIWPFYFKNTDGIGTTNEQENLTVVPFYSRSRSPLRDQTSYGWPLGYNAIDDREQKYVEHDLFWPIFVKARGSKSITRIFPFYSQATNADLESDFYLWPVYKFNSLRTASLERKRTRILFFLYSDTTETNTTAKDTWMHRNDFWPFYSYHRDLDGNQRLQILAVVEPFFPNNRSIRREYSPIVSFWRWEKNHKAGASSQSLFWNLYRLDETPHSKKLSLLFGLFQYQSGAEGRRWRVCHVIVKQKAAATAPSKS